MKRLLVFLAVFVPAIALVYFLSGGSIFPKPEEPLPADEPAAADLFDAPGADETESAIRLGGSPTVRRLSAIDFELRLYREMLDPATHQRLFLRSVDFHGDRSESVSDREIAIRSPRITFHEILDARKPKAEATRPMVTVTALRGTLEAVGPDGRPRPSQEYDLCRLVGDVRVTFLAEGTVLKTETLDCFFDERLVRTADAVEIEHGVASLVGKGLEAAGLERTWTILRDATLVATDPETGEDSVLVAPNGFVFTGEAADEAAEGGVPPGDDRALPPVRGGTARARGGVRLEQWSGRRGDGIEPRFEAEAESAEAVLEGIERPKGDAVGAVGRSLRALELGGGVRFSDTRGLSGRGGSLTLDRGQDELVIADRAVIEIDARAQKLPAALAAGPASGEIRRLVLSARDEARVSGLGGGAPRSLRLRGAASLRPFGERESRGGGLTGDEIEIAFEPREKSEQRDDAPVTVRDITAFGGAALDLPGAGTLRGPEIRLGSAGGGKSGEDAVFEVVVPSHAELRLASDGLLASSLPGALRQDDGNDSEKERAAGEGHVIVRCAGPLEYLAPRPGSPGRLRLTHSVEVEEWSGGTRTFRMTARNAEASLVATEAGGFALATLSAQGRVSVEAPRGRLRARRLDFDASDKKLACEGEPAELEVADPESGKTAERLAAARLTYFGALGLVEAADGVEATIHDVGRFERRRSGAAGGDERPSAQRDFRARVGGTSSAGPATLRCGKFRALLAESESGFEFEDLLAEVGVEVQSGDDVAKGEVLTVARRGAAIGLIGRGDRPARLERKSPDDPERRETVTGPRILFEPGEGEAEVATLPDGGEIVLWRARSRDPLSVARIRDKADAAKPPVKGLVRTVVTTSGPIRLETGKEIAFSSPVRIEQEDEAGAFVSRLEGDRLRLELAPDAATEADAFVAATLTGSVRFETPQARGTGGLLVYDAKKARLFLQRGDAGQKATLRFAKGLDLAGRLIEYDPETGDASLHDFDIDPR